MDLSLSELGDGDGQGVPACCDSWDHKELDMNEQLNWPDGTIYKASDIDTTAFIKVQELF